MKISNFAPSIFLLYCLTPNFANAQSPSLSCNVGEYQNTSNIEVSQNAGILNVSWTGQDQQNLSLALEVIEGAPVIRALDLWEGNNPRKRLLTDAKIEYQVVEGFRRISNQQLAPLRELNVELTQAVVDQFKWDVFWDAPLLISERLPAFVNNPPPAEGVAQQPGLPRSEDEISRGTISYAANACSVSSRGSRVEIRYEGVSLGSFSGDLLITVFEGTNLIKTSVEASTNLPSVAYKYDAGITGIALNDTSEVLWRDIAGQDQAYGLRGPLNSNYAPVRAANRLIVASQDGLALAAFPPPHIFFWSREIEINVGNNWYRKDSESTYSIGIRQGEQEVVERYQENWSLYSAPPGSIQKMTSYFYPVIGEGENAFDAALAFTRGDVYKPLQGFKVFGSHYHTNLGSSLLATGSLDSRLPDFEVLRSAGIDIAGPVDRPRDETQLLEQHWLFEGAQRHSDDEFMVLPEMENSNLLGGHWDLLFSHPVYYVDSRPAGTPLVTKHPEYGRQYNIGSVEDMMAMIEAENMLIYMPHPRTKGSTGYPDALRNTSQFLNDRYRGAGWRWGMGLDLSEKRLSDYRVIPLLDEMNNWIADTDLQLKSIMAITETYAKQPGDDIYANGPVTYLQLDELPSGDDYSPIINALKNGEYFVSSGEVLIPSHEVIENGANSLYRVNLEWTFPMEFIEVVYGDGESVKSEIIDATDFGPFGSQSIDIPFDARGQAWVRFAAWDTAGNGAMTVPVRLNQ